MADIQEEQNNLQDKRYKNNLLVKLEMMRNNYPELNIPHFDINTENLEIRSALDICLSEIDKINKYNEIYLSLQFLKMFLDK